MNGAELRIGGLQALSTIDYPGELAAVLFCQGCPWRCRYCHNGDLITSRGKGAIPWRKVIRWLERRRRLLDAVVFSGGEPTLQADLPLALSQVRGLGFKTGLHTAGIYPDRLSASLPLLDWVGLDIKAEEQAYPALTGTPDSGAAAWESARRLIASGIRHEIRVTLHPELIPPAGLAGILRRLNAMGAPSLVIQPCQTRDALDPALRRLPPAGLVEYAPVIGQYTEATTRVA